MTDREKKAIGDLKRNFVHRSPVRQKHMKFSASEASGNISLAYYRGLAEREEEVTRLKEEITRLKAKLNP